MGIPAFCTISAFMKLLLVEVEFHANRRTDRQTDMTKLIFVFCKSDNAPKNECFKV